jgi:hypothetical protein
MTGRRTLRIHSGLNNVNIDTKASSVPTSQETICLHNKAQTVDVVTGVTAV